MFGRATGLKRTMAKLGSMIAAMAVAVDFIARGASEDEWLMVLVEEGQWAQPFEARLRMIQERLYGCIDAAIDGQLAAQFPETLGKRIVVRLDCYDAPEPEVSGFFERFSEGALTSPEYRRALTDSTYVSDLQFQLNLDTAR